MKKPRILLSAASKNGAMKNYALAVEAAGGTVLGGYCPSAAPDEYDGLVLCGGGDLDPALYHMPNLGSIEIDCARDRAEWKLLDDCVRLGKPVLGICRGLQFINVWFGGTLIQDLTPNLKIFHSQQNGADGIHPIRTEKSCLLHSLYGTCLSVNSAHHQAIGALAPGLIVSARSEGDVPEAVLHETLPIFAVQFHPERMCLSYQTPQLANGLLLFSRFIALCERKGL